jgi:hypothetical protein
MTPSRCLVKGPDFIVLVHQCRDFMDTDQSKMPEIARIAVHKGAAFMDTLLLRNASLYVATPEARSPISMEHIAWFLPGY